METTLLAVNGTLMRGLELNPNLLAVGATFVREDETDACYRLWSIGDRHPAMQRTPGTRTRVALELWAVPVAGLARLLQSEPPGLAIGKVVLKDGSIVLGVLGEPFLCEGQREISEFGGWRAYTASPIYRADNKGGKT
ncbi:MAG TPA: glutamyl-tRNA amidotransferase [Caldimonas sp.]|jgi:hypothetical protein